MLDQFGTLTVRECRMTRAEVERIVAENLQRRGPDSYEFDYEHPIMIWGRDGGLTVRWPSADMRDQPGRSPRSMDLLPWPEFVKRQAELLRREEERRQSKAACPTPSSPSPGGEHRPAPSTEA